MIKLVLFALCLCAVPPALSQTPALSKPEVQTVKALGDKRDAAGLLAYLTPLPERTTELLEAALYALASVQADTATEKIFALTNHPSEKVRVAAAFALGQTLRVSKNAAAFEEKFFEVLKSEAEPRVRAALLEALGKFGGGEALRKMTATPLGKISGTLLSAAQALSIARFAIRGVKSSEAAIKAASLSVGLEEENADFNTGVYALMRMADGALLAGAEPALLKAAASKNPSTRMHAASALGRVRSKAALMEVFRLTRDKDWRVAVNALRAFQNVNADTLKSPAVKLALTNALLGALSVGSRHHVVKTAIEIVPRLPVDSVIGHRLQRVAHESASHDLNGAALLSLARKFPDLAATELEKMQTAAVLSPAALEAIGVLAEIEQKTRPKFLVWLGETAGANLTKLSASALESWGKCWKVSRKEKSSPQSVPDSVFESLCREVLNQPAPAPSALATAASILTDSVIADKKYAAWIASALRRLPQSTVRAETETVMALLDALIALGDSAAASVAINFLQSESRAVQKKAIEVCEKFKLKCMASSPTAQAGALPESWAWASGYKSNPVVVIETSKGTIAAELFIDEATYTVKNFLDLASKNFYDGLAFHRVVPNFVVQGGDPKGDGSGGPPYSIRSEFTVKSYGRGMIGMASAGKDTEGSQFFFMHSAHPHLDGLYTLFGEVISGMDTVDRLEVGDKIISVRVK